MIHPNTRTQIIIGAIICREEKTIATINTKGIISTKKNFFNIAPPYTREYTIKLRLCKLFSFILFSMFPTL